VRTLVTGAAGFIGSNLARRLARDGHEVVALDDFSCASFKNLVDVDADVVTCDPAANPAALERLGRFDVIFHQASITDTTVLDQRRMMVNNVEAYRADLDFAMRTNARVVWASSASIYGRGAAPMKESQPPDPLNVYAFSKLSMERLARRCWRTSPQPIVGLRYFNVYGPGEDHKGEFASMIHKLAKQMRAGHRPRVFAAGQQKRDFVFVEDVVSANLLGARAKTSGVYNVGAGGAWSFNEVIRQLSRVLASALTPDYFENPFSFTQDWTEADLTESRKSIGYEPKYDLARGIDAYMATGKLGAA
jgi:ADP-L-glycero-D-manno-heptose 6-epimerase